ncbi:6764_t:CDS:2 [Racocetra fulgida]|uniref:6764_t:CDS:1 n=1 Tax=Racocetra fulgida TaxID=60492 RepID=A0A9N8ZXE5_9GLOM|nr:6764_t:CDS:2 [Racocetra fulgida]
MGYDDSEICKMLFIDIYFHPYIFKIENLNLVISGIGKSNDPNWHYAGKGYQSSFVHNFHKIRSVFFQEFNHKEAIVRIYQNFQEIHVFSDTDPNTVWNKIDSTKDQAMLKQLYECGYLCTAPENYKNIANQFWDAFRDALDINSRRIDGKEEYSRHYARVNGPGGIQLEKPKITLERLTPEKR